MFCDLISVNQHYDGQSTFEGKKMESNIDARS